jgi:hypothetical protein
MLAEQLGQVLDVIAETKLEAEPAQVSYLRGAQAAVLVIAGQTDDARSSAA